MLFVQMEAFLILEGGVNCMGHRDRRGLRGRSPSCSECNSEWAARFSQGPSDTFGTVWRQIQLICGLYTPYTRQQTFIENLCGFVCVCLKGLLLPGKNVYRDIRQGPGDPQLYRKIMNDNCLKEGRLLSYKSWILNNLLVISVFLFVCLFVFK